MGIVASMEIMGSCDKLLDLGHNLNIHIVYDGYIQVCIVGWEVTYI
jgi:hypothetical protein